MQFLFAHFLHVTKATFIWRKLVLSRMVTLPDLFFMWTQACPEGMCTNGTLVPCEVLSLAPGSTSSTFFEQWCGFFYVPQEQISVSAMRRDLRLTYEEKLGRLGRVSLLAEQANFSVVYHHTCTRFATFCKEMYEKARPG